MKRFVLSVALLVLPLTAGADVPFQFAAPNLRAPDDPNVGGMRFSVIHGSNESVSGVDFGFFSLSRTSRLNGFSAILGVCQVTGGTTGVASAVMNLHSGTDRGVNAAFINKVSTVHSGANIGFVNISDEKTMVDLGGINVATRALVQLGFINVANDLDSFQFGFVNIAENGFLPFFPVFNFPKN